MDGTRDCPRPHEGCSISRSVHTSGVRGKLHRSIMSFFQWPNRVAIYCVTGLTLIGVQPARASDNLRLDDNVAPTFQAISLVVDADQKNYTGSVQIELQ